MESFFSRYRNLVVLLAVLLVQVIGLAVQVRRPVTASGGAGAPSGDTAGKDGKGVLLIRLWAASLVTPFEYAMHASGADASGVWKNYIDLRHTRDENKELQQTIDRLRLEQAELHEDALQGQRLQAMLKFQEGYIYQTMPAQVIGTSGSSISHVIWLDKGSSDGLKPDMAVITGEGIVGKVRDVFAHTAQVLVINDQTSGAGVVLETTRIRGILRGNAAGQPQVINILADTRIQPGEHVLTAGGDQIFPRGLPVGQVQKVEQDKERGSFINVIIQPAANLQHLEEVLVITSLEPHLSAEQQADLTTSEELKGAEVAAEAQRKKAAAEMAERLPGLKDPNAPDAADGSIAGAGAGAKTGAAAKAIDPKTGLPVPPVVVVPKPLPAKHADRFSPGGAPAAGTGGNDSGGDAGAGAGTGAGTGAETAAPDDAVSAPKAAPKKQPAKPIAPKAGTPKGRTP